MISRLACPTVCVIDDEEAEYRPILSALNHLNIGCVHYKGDVSSNLPSTQLRGLRLVITDLHLSSNPSGKPSVSHTANAFKAVVSVDSAPVVVVIWSKYADEKLDIDLPPDDQPTEAELFKNELLEAEEKFRGRLIFVQMAKPKPGDRPENWVAELKEQIESTLQGHDAVDALFTWESIVKDAINRVSEELTSLAQPQTANTEPQVDPYPDVTGNLKLIMQLLAHAQGGADCSENTAPRHLATVLGQSLLDQMEHSSRLDMLSSHGTWLCHEDGNPKEGSIYAPKINEFLLSAESSGTVPFLPGTIYRLGDAEFEKIFGLKVGALACDCYQDGAEISRKEWRTLVKPVLLEISPECDVAQNNRKSALLLAGLIAPEKARPNAKDRDSFQALPTFSFRYGTEDFKEDKVFLVFCSRYKTTLTTKDVPAGLTPWFRLRELPTASLRNWHSAHASRVGYVSLKAAV